MKKRGGMREILVGAVLAVAFFISLFLVVAVGEQKNLWAPKARYRVRFPAISGLQKGAPVRLVGVPIGTVYDISFPENPDDFSIIVTLKVDRSVANRIRRDTKAGLETEGLLGDVLIELEGGSPQSPLAPPGSYLEAEIPIGFADFKSQGARIAENIITISDGLKTIVKSVQSGEGLLARLLNDPDLGSELVQNLENASGRMDRLLQGLEGGEGLVGRLLQDRDYGTRVAENLEESTRHLAAISRRLDEGRGPLGALLLDTPETSDLVTNLAAISRGLRTVAGDLEAGRGLIGRLASDDETAEAVLANLEEASRHLASITRKIDSGEGTVGQLIEDPAVYESLSNILGGVERSRVLRWFVRHEQMKGLKRAEEEGKP